MISNFDIYEWAKELDIKFDGVFDNPPSKVKSAVFNLDKYGSGTHWTCVVNGYYFDPFGLAPPEHVKHLVKRYNTLQYQMKTSMLCGYICLYFMKKCQDHSYYDILYKLLDLLDPEKNEKIIVKSYDGKK